MILLEQVTQSACYELREISDIHHILSTNTLVCAFDLSMATITPCSQADPHILLINSRKLKPLLHVWCLELENDIVA